MIDRNFFLLYNGIIIYYGFPIIHCLEVTLCVIVIYFLPWLWEMSP